MKVQEEVDVPTSDPDYYASLRVDPTANSVTIRKAVVRELRKWGARQNANDPAESHEARRQVQLLADISSVLLDPTRKAIYDEQQAHPNDEQAEDEAERMVADANVVGFKTDSGGQLTPERQVHDSRESSPPRPLSKGECELLSQIEANLPDFISVVP